jgi:hypothetical protein
VSNLRQLGLFCHIYANDNEDRLPEDLKHETLQQDDTFPFSHYGFWEDTIGTQGGVGEILICPSSNKWVPWAWTYSYGEELMVSRRLSLWFLTSPPVRTHRGSTPRTSTLGSPPRLSDSTP